MDRNMRILLVCVWLAADVGGLSMAPLNKPDVEYIKLGERLRLEFPRETKSISKLTLRKQLPSGQHEDQVVVAEWVRSSPAKETVYGTYEGRTELDEKNRVIVIGNMTKDDNGVYYFIVDQTPAEKLYNVVVIEDVPKPSVVKRPPCAPQSAKCSLACEGNITDAGPVTYRWRKDRGEWTVSDSGQNLSLTNDEEWEKVEKVSCEMRNPVSVARSDPSDNPFYREEGNTPAIIGGTVGGIFLILAVVGLVLGVICRDHKRSKKGVLPSCGSKPDVSEATNASSQRNENEVSLLMEEESTSDKNNHHSTNEFKGNKKQCQRLVKRVDELEQLLQALELKGAGQNSGDVEEAKVTLEAAKDVEKKYRSDISHEHVFRDYKDGSEFGSLNGRLNGALNKLSKALQLGHSPALDMLFDDNPLSRRAEDEADRREDHEELKRIMDLTDRIWDEAASLSRLCEEDTVRNKSLVEHVDVLKELKEAIKEKGPGPNSAGVEEALRELETALESWPAMDHGKEFDSLNNGLGNALDKLSSALLI